MLFFFGGNVNFQKFQFSQNSTVDQTCELSLHDKFYIPLLFFRSAYEQFQKVDCVWGMESEYNGYNYISSKTPFSVAKPIFTPHSFPAVSKKGISQKILHLQTGCF